MSERWGDRDVSEDTGLVASRIEDIEEQLRRIADVLEFWAERQYGYGRDPAIRPELPPPDLALMEAR